VGLSKKQKMSFAMEMEAAWKSLVGFAVGTRCLDGKRDEETIELCWI
jgi:hypothetical protein